MSYNMLLSKLPFLKKKSRIYKSINKAEKSNLASKYKNLIYYKSNVKAKKGWNIQYMVLGLVSSHLEKHEV